MDDIQLINRKVNHYKWLDKHLNTFWLSVFGKSLRDTFSAGIVSAHGDKGYQYQSDWANAGIPFPHAMAMYMLTYTNVMDMEKHQSREWVIQNYPKYRDKLPPIEISDPDIINIFAS